MDIGKLVAVEYWPHTNKWRILVAGVAVGYWDAEEDARSSARQARRELREAVNNARVKREMLAAIAQARGE